MVSQGSRLMLIKRTGLGRGSGCLMCILLAYAAAAAFLFERTACAGAADARSASERATTAHQWIVRCQSPKTGLVRSYDMPGNQTAWTYDQALAIRGLLAVGDTR